MKNSILKEKSFGFGLRIIVLSKSLQAEKREFVMSKQLLRCGTSVGALISEAQYGQSKADFICKMNIALKEANEAVYWLDLLYGSKYLTGEQYSELSVCITDIVRMLAATVRTAKGNTK